MPLLIEFVLVDEYCLRQPLLIEVRHHSFVLIRNNKHMYYKTHSSYQLKHYHNKYTNYPQLSFSFKINVIYDTRHPLIYNSLLVNITDKATSLTRTRKEKSKKFSIVCTLSAGSTYDVAQDIDSAMYSSRVT